MSNQANSQGVSIIIPTTCSSQRESSLLRAIDSSLNQADINIEVIVVVNGMNFDQRLFEKLKLINDVSVYYCSEGNVSKARYFGINHITFDAFGFLDDDDEILPNTLKYSYQLLKENPDTAVVVSNGYFYSSGDKIHVDADFYKDIVASNENSFLEKNWFTTPAALYNINKVDKSIFDISYKYFELTYIFFKLIENNYKIIFNNTVSYRYYEDTVMSASKLESYKVAYPDMLKIIMGLNLSEVVKNKLNDKYIVSLNGLSVYYLENNQFKMAIYYHLKCLFSGGLKYILYTRRILYTIIASVLKM